MLGAVRCVARISSHPALLAAIASLAFLPAAAQAELSVTLVGNDALEDRPMTFVATGTTSATTEIYGKLRHARGVPCAPSYSTDAGSGLFFADPTGAQEVITRDDPGSYVLCAYLATSSAATPLEALTLPVAVRPNNATLSLRVPSNGFRGVGVPVTIAGTTELDRNVYATAKPVGAGPCGRSRAADPASNAFAFFEPGAGAFSIPRLAGPFATWSLRTLRLAAGRQG